MSEKIEQLQSQSKNHPTDRFAENKVTSFVPLNIKSIRDMETERQSTSKGEKLEKFRQMPQIGGDIDEGFKMEESYSKYA